MRMMHEEDERPPNEKSHAYHFSITYNGCDFCLLTPSAILTLPKWLFKGWRLKFRGFICLRSCSRHCNWNWSALHKDEHKIDAKHKKLLNLLCIVYISIFIISKKNQNKIFKFILTYVSLHVNDTGNTPGIFQGLIRRRISGPSQFKN